MIGVPEKSACYNIQGLVPRIDMPYGSAYNFAIHVKSSVALKFRDIKLTSQQMINFNDLVAKCLQPMWGNQKIRHSMERPILFYKDTILLRCCDVPGDACNLGIDGTDLEYLDRYDTISYVPHNIDTMQQAFSLLCIWTFWIEHALAFLKD